MARRSWRNFDFVLLGALFALSVYGVIMIYSATIDTLGLGNPVQRQIIYLAVGIGILLVVASVDYRLLDIIQHPFHVLTPLVLSLTGIGLVMTWQVTQGGVTEFMLTFQFFRPLLPPMVISVALVFIVFLSDRTWLEKLDLTLPRLALSAGVILFIVAAFLALRRSTGDAAVGLASYWMVVALAAVYLLDCLTLRFTDTLRNPVYVLVLVMLGILFMIGQVSGGAQSWLLAGAVQPSELSKILIIIVLADFMARREDGLDRLSTVLTSLGIVILPTILIYLQPDLGTALILLAIWATMIWMAGIRFRHLLVLLAAGIAALPLVWFSLKDYMQKRLLLFINPTSDPDSYFNVHQALVSIGSGGWLGKGLTHGTQSQLHFLRVRHTDFIFAVTAEELGFLGAMVMMGLIFLLLWRVLRIAENARDTFGRLIAAGVAGLILFQSVINIGMNLGLMPVTGLPLPFVSYGGSSFLTLMLGMGLVESVAMRHKKLEFD
jgi:rod shape determining protein RodA